MRSIFSCEWLELSFQQEKKLKGQSGSMFTELVTSPSDQTNEEAVSSLEPGGVLRAANSCLSVAIERSCARFSCSEPTAERPRSRAARPTRRSPQCPPSWLAVWLRPLRARRHCKTRHKTLSTCMSATDCVLGSATAAAFTSSNLRITVARPGSTQPTLNMHQQKRARTSFR